MAIVDCARSPRASAERGQAVALAYLGAAALVLVVGFEIARPSLPVPFELAAAARAPGAAPLYGRLPMALGAVCGLLALYTLLRRTADPRSGAYAVAILATVPAWFVHGRLMTGAIIPMACFVVVLAGLGVAALDPRTSAWGRAVACVIAVVAAAGSSWVARWGVPSRGVLAVVAVPAIAVGAAGCLWWRPERGAVLSPPRGAAAARMTSAAVLAAGGVIGLVAAVVGVVRPESSLADALLGARASVPASATFEAPVAALAYGLVPWTPLVPFALARRPSSAGHLAVMLGAVLAIGVHALLAPRSGPGTIVGVAAIAAAVAMMLRGLEDARRPAMALVATVLVIGWLVAHDLGLAPDRALVAFGVSDAAIPAAHAAASSHAVRAAVWLGVLLTGMSLLVPRPWLPVGRGLALLVGGVFAGLLLRLHAYPALLTRLSPGAAVLAGHESSTLLAVSPLAPGERSKSPLDRLVLDAAPLGIRREDDRRMPITSGPSDGHDRTPTGVLEVR